MNKEQALRIIRNVDIDSTKTRRKVAIAILQHSREFWERRLQDAKHELNEIYEALGLDNTV